MHELCVCETFKPYIANLFRLRVLYFVDFVKGKGTGIRFTRKSVNSVEAYCTRENDVL